MTFELHYKFQLNLFFFSRKKIAFQFICIILLPLLCSLFQDGPKLHNTCDSNTTQTVYWQQKLISTDSSFLTVVKDF